MKDFGKIYLTWRKGLGFRRIPVGFLTQSATQGIKFQYEIEKVKEAEKDGFLPYTGYPDTQKVYETNVLEVFGQRLLKSGRNDVSEFYKFWLVHPKKKHDTFYMLAQTQGLIPTDNFEFLADFNPRQNLRFVTELVGLSRIELLKGDIEVGEVLRYELEPNNPKDSMAVAVVKKGRKLGYVKIIHSRLFHKTKRPIRIVVHHLEGSDRLKRVFLSINM